MATLTSFDRVNRVFAREDHDRIPRYESFWDDTILQWKCQGHLESEQDALAYLKADLQNVGCAWIKPAGQEILLSEDEQIRTIRNTWGATIRVWKQKSGTPEHIAFDCDTRAKWENIYKPALLAYKPDFVAEECVNLYRYGRKSDLWCCFTGIESFEALRELLGDEVTMIAMATDPEWIVDVSRTYTDVLLRTFEAALAKGIEPDGMWIYGDMAYNHSTMCSPQMYQDLIWPDHKRTAERYNRKLWMTA